LTSPFTVAYFSTPTGTLYLSFYSDAILSMSDELILLQCNISNIMFYCWLYCFGAKIEAPKAESAEVGFWEGVMTGADVNIFIFDLLIAHFDGFSGAKYCYCNLALLHFNLALWYSIFFP